MIQSDSILRLPEVEKTVGLKRSAIYSRVTAGTFPQPVKLGTRNVGWLASEIQGWIRAAAENRKQQDAPGDSSHA